VQLTKSLAVAWAENNIQVNSIAPGWLDTDLTQAARRDFGERKLSHKSNI
jgi:2-deoxy-D-gluconate 3-dehydrogenase